MRTTAFVNAFAILLTALPSQALSGHGGNSVVEPALEARGYGHGKVRFSENIHGHVDIKEGRVKEHFNFHKNVHGHGFEIEFGRGGRGRKGRKGRKGFKHGYGKFFGANPATSSVAPPASSNVATATSVASPHIVSSKAADTTSGAATAPIATSSVVSTTSSAAAKATGAADDDDDLPYCEEE